MKTKKIGHKCPPKTLSFIFFNPVGSKGKMLKVKQSQRNDKYNLSNQGDQSVHEWIQLLNHSTNKMSISLA